MSETEELTTALATACDQLRDSQAKVERLTGLLEASKDDFNLMRLAGKDMCDPVL